MAALWSVEYWSESGEIFPVEQWLDKRTQNQLKGIAKEIKLLERCGNTLRLPHSKALGDGLFELRERIYGYRIYYAFRPGRNIILLQAGDKVTQKKDIKIAYERLSKIQNYLNWKQEQENEIEKV